MSTWKLTVRHGSDVSRRAFDDLDEALAAAREVTEEILAEGPLEPVKAIRDYEPAQLINARLEISGKGLFSAPTAGLDIRGDGSLEPFAGGMRRKPLEAEGKKQAFDAIRQALQS